MATGLEALGTASAVIQLISFAGSLVSLSFKIYDGVPTAENELEEYSTKMMHAAQRIQSRNSQVPQTPVDDRLSKVAQDCVEAAEELRKETQVITKRFQKGKGKVFQAVYSAFRGDKHRAMINELNKTFIMCKEVMETELLLKICDKSTTIEQKQSQGFQSLEKDVQDLILKMAEGHTRIEQLVSSEAKTTRDAINTHLTSELTALSVRNISDYQRQRLLKSLKSEEIRERYNAVLPSSDACFERVFASYERVCRKDPGYKDWNKIVLKPRIYSRGPAGKVDEIDQLWEGFCSWLRSSEKLFWIRGKPGSGKSTLIKYIIDDDNTKSLLNSWSPNTRILSHFFWKIGSEPQNSIKGLLCTLLHDLLSDDNDAIDRVLSEFKFSRSKDFYKEWSSQEVEEILFSVLRASNCSTCVFIDGLDEISNKDGFPALLKVIQRFRTYQRVKVCVSSRPETELVSSLEAVEAQKLKLEDLTKPEMVVHILKELKQVSQIQEPAFHLEDFTEALISKAQGVFLWLALATSSLKDGLLNGDDQIILSQRIEELPEQLEALYETMWARLNGNNRVYRETAARYFRCAIAESWPLELRIEEGLQYPWLYSEHSLAEISLAVNVEDNLVSPPKGNERTLVEINDLCDKTADDIRTSS
ncbi:hypothetical protein IL306_006620 [Fusarium sp. DS 682]|nr:hypothetical protein IL306_006620 [Fusarium sp. DS 682]